MLWLCKACRERAAASGDTAKRRNKNRSLIPETHTNKRGFVQTGLGPQQRPAWGNKEQHQTDRRLVIMPLFLFEHAFIFFHFEIMEYNMCADPFSKSVGDGSTAPAHFDSWIQAKSSDAREWYNLKIVPCATVCFANLSLTRQKKKTVGGRGGNCVNNVRTLTSHQGSRGTWSGRRWCQPRSWGTRLQAEAPAWSLPLCSSDSASLKREVNLGRATEEAETTWTNPELGGAREVTPAYSPIRDKVWNAGPVVICTGVFQIIMITWNISDLWLSSEW